MANPTDGMDGPLWPADWSTGWITFKYSDIVGNPIQGSVNISLSANRLVSMATHTTVYAGSFSVPLLDGAPTPDTYTTTNTDGDVCIEVPRGDDPDIQPYPIQLLVRESWSGTTITKTVTAEHTLENPLWISGDLTSVAAQAGLVMTPIWEVVNESSGIPIDAKVNDIVWYQDTGRITRVTA